MNIVMRLGAIFCVILTLCGCDRRYERSMGASQLCNAYIVDNQPFTESDVMSLPAGNSTVAIPAYSSTIAVGKISANKACRINKSTLTNNPDHTGIVSTTTAAANLYKMQTWLGLAAEDSLLKCNQFLARVSFQKNTWESSLGISALAMSGAAAVTLLPATWAASLSAGSTFATGTRAIIDSDIYGQTGAALIVSEIRQDYYPQMQKFLNSLSVKNQVDFIRLYGQLLQIHEACSLNVAINNLNQKGTASSTVNTQINSATSLRDGAQYDIPGLKVETLKINNGNVTIGDLTKTPVSTEQAANMLNALNATLKTPTDEPAPAASASQKPTTK